MDLVIAHDLTKHGDDALRAARILSADGGGLAATLVVVLTQRDLDRTGELFTAEKLESAIEKTYPRVWKIVSSVLEEEGAEGHGLEVDVVVRLAPGHLVRSEAKIAEMLLEVARDFRAPRIVLGKRGRPDSVAEHVVAAGHVEAPPPGASPSAFIVRLEEVSPR